MIARNRLLHCQQKWFFLLLFLLGIASVGCMPIGFAKDLGVVGVTFPIAEMSLLQWIAIQVEAYKNDPTAVIERIARKVNRPQPVDLPRASKKRSYYYNPTLTLTKDITDANGHVLFAKGVHVNGLAMQPHYAPCWMFLNADDAKQLQFAQSQKARCAHPKIILTGGSIRRVQQVLHAAVYFDQGGRLSQKLGLNAVPALVTRKGNRLFLREIPVG